MRAEYRKGIGAAGNVKAGALAQLLDRPLGVKGVSNPEPASGGVDPESEESARASIPLGVRTLGRAVSLLDYEDFARAFSGVAKANAAVLQLRAGKTVVVTVAFEGGDRLDDLADALRTHGDPRVEVLVLAGTTQTFKLALKVAVDPAYESDAVLSGVEAALRAAYSFDARAFTDPVFRSQIESVGRTRSPGVGARGRRRRACYTRHAPRGPPRTVRGSTQRRREQSQRPGGKAGGTTVAGTARTRIDVMPFDWLAASVVM